MYAVFNEYGDVVPIEVGVDKFESKFETDMEATLWFNRLFKTAERYGYEDELEEWTIREV